MQPKNVSLKNYFLAVFLLFLISIIFYLFYIYAIFFVNKSCDPTIILSGRTYSVSDEDFWLKLTDAIIFSPLIEEYFFRYFIIGYCFKKRLFFGLLISSFLFSSAHMVYYGLTLTLTHYLLIFLFGLFLGFIYIYKSKNIIYPLMIHAIVNLLMIFKSHSINYIYNIFC